MTLHEKKEIDRVSAVQEKLWAGYGTHDAKCGLLLWVDASSYEKFPILKAIYREAYDQQLLVNLLEGDNTDGKTDI